jgi:hypothetical protein
MDPERPWLGRECDWAICKTSITKDGVHSDQHDSSHTIFLTNAIRTLPTSLQGYVAAKLIM